MTPSPRERYYARRDRAGDRYRGGHGAGFARPTAARRDRRAPDRPARFRRTRIRPSDEADACGAGKLGRWLNVLPTEDVKREIAATVGERPIRYYTEGDPVTMDFNPARLNAELGADGRIKRFRCG